MKAESRPKPVKTEPKAKAKGRKALSFDEEAGPVGDKAAVKGAAAAAAGAAGKSTAAAKRPAPPPPAPNPAHKKSKPGEALSGLQHPDAPPATAHACCGSATLTGPALSGGFSQ